jgi:hypothetical protein
MWQAEWGDINNKGFVEAIEVQIQICALKLRNCDHNKLI